MGLERPAPEGGSRARRPHWIAADAQFEQWKAGYGKLLIQADPGRGVVCSHEATMTKLDSKTLKLRQVAAG